jgi:hypothetical protein
MISLKTTLLATAFIGAGILTAAAQSGSGGSMQPSTPRAGAANQNITSATHCKTASGQVQMKSASGSASGTTGANTSGSGMSGSSGASGSGSLSGVSPAIVATLPNC